jgi:uncharacterized protein (TIGR00251 family)
MKINVKARPNSRENRIEKIDEQNYVVSVKELPVKGRANAAIVREAAKYFSVPEYRVKIVSGFMSRNKILEIFL